MNTDNKYQIINLRTKFSDLPNFIEFKSLFSEYKIKDFTIKLVPTYATNMQSVAAIAYPVPNYEVFAVPANFTDDTQDFSTWSATQIDLWLNQTQRKRMSIMPNRPRIYVTKKPRVAKIGGPLDKDAVGVPSITMGRPYWLSTNPPAFGSPLPDETKVEHYGMRILIRRVDGEAIPSDLQPMGFRVHHQVNFMCRKVQ
ncbi:hypothetical protein [Shewanella sp.]|uniref:hypothetical protein n=1 Tax=Shewanella sp. TaxID=50422 RepID=UPI004048D11E